MFNFVRTKNKRNNSTQSSLHHHCDYFFFLFFSFLCFLSFDLCFLLHFVSFCCGYNSFIVGSLKSVGSSVSIVVPTGSTRPISSSFMSITISCVSDSSARLCSWLPSSLLHSVACSLAKSRPSTCSSRNWKKLQKKLPLMKFRFNQFKMHL